MPTAVAFTERASQLLGSVKFWRGTVAIVAFILIWEIASRTGLSRCRHQWGGCHLQRSDARSELLVQLVFERAARVYRLYCSMLLGIPLGLGMAVSRTFYGISFPVFEVLRPIPPLASVPAAIIFWPTQELSIMFVTFLGAFYTVVINVIGGAQTIDVRYFQAARSMGSSSWDIFRRIILAGHDFLYCRRRDGRHRNCTRPSWSPPR